MRSLVIPLAFAWLTACATIDAPDCRNAYDVGFRDAIFGLQRQEGVYVPLCEKHGAPLDLGAYGRGWQEGYYEFEQRKIHGGVD
jgi:hypothetical protein